MEEIMFKFKQTTENRPTLEERLIQDGAIDMRDNYQIEELNDGYVVIKPIDETKKWKKDMTLIEPEESNVEKRREVLKEALKTAKVIDENSQKSVDFVRRCYK
jgi:hypothetical protein